jgi:hypothetical protein
MLLPELPLAPLEPVAAGVVVVVVVVVDSVAEVVLAGAVMLVVGDVDGAVALLPVVPENPEVVSVEAVRLQPLSAVLNKVAAKMIFNR